MKPVPILIVGPSGVGKSTIIKKIVSLFPNLKTYKTTTTRPPRNKENDSYYFVTKEKFKQMVKNGEMIEWEKIHGNYYGTQKKHILDVIAKGKYPVPANAIDIKGVMSYKKIFPDLLVIFISYDSLSELPNRIRKTRPETNEKEIKVRMATAQEEMKQINKFKHIVINKEGKLDQTIDKIKKIISKELSLKPKE